MNAPEGFVQFAQEVHRALPDEWNTDHNPQTDVRPAKASFVRDDLTGFSLDYKTSDEWPPEDFWALIPHEAGVMAPDRPGMGTTYDVDPHDVSATVDVITREMPEYQGTFEYDDE